MTRAIIRRVFGWIGRRRAIGCTLGAWATPTLKHLCSSDRCGLTAAEVWGNNLTLPPSFEHLMKAGVLDDGGNRRIVATAGEIRDAPANFMEQEVPCAERR